VAKSELTWTMHYIRRLCVPLWYEHRCRQVTYTKQQLGSIYHESKTIVAFNVGRSWMLSIISNSYYCHSTYFSHVALHRSIYCFYTLPNSTPCVTLITDDHVLAT
jgi:hypothetical protein